MHMVLTWQSLRNASVGLFPFLFSLVHVIIYSFAVIAKSLDFEIDIAIKIQVLFISSISLWALRHLVRKWFPYKKRGVLNIMYGHIIRFFNKKGLVSNAAEVDNSVIVKRTWKNIEDYILKEKNDSDMGPSSKEFLMAKRFFREVWGLNLWSEGNFASAVSYLHISQDSLELVSDGVFRSEKIVSNYYDEELLPQRVVCSVLYYISFISCVFSLKLYDLASVF